MILPTAFSLPGMVREEKTTMSPGASVGDRMLVLGDARQRGARLALAAGRERRESCRAADGRSGSWPSKGRHAVEIAAFARDRDDPLHRAADHHDLPAVGEARLGRGAQTRDIGGEGRDDDAAVRLADQFGEVRRDVGLRRALALAQHVGRIADQREHALVAERLAGALRRSARRSAASRRSSSRRCARRARPACGSPARSSRGSNGRPR